MSVEYTAKDTPRRLLRSIRIHRRFAIPDLLRSVPGVSRKSAANFVKRLERHGYVAPIPGHVSGRPGSHQWYRLVCDPGPEVPETCPHCKNRLNLPCQPIPNDPASRPDWHKLPRGLVRRVEKQYDPY